MRQEQKISADLISYRDWLLTQSYVATDKGLHGQNILVL